MSTPIPLRSDFDAMNLRKLARGSRDPDQTRRLLALGEIYDGGSHSDAARIGGVGLQIVRDWVVRFNAKGNVSLIPHLAFALGKLFGILISLSARLPAGEALLLFRDEAIHDLARRVNLLHRCPQSGSLRSLQLLKALAADAVDARSASEPLLDGKS